MTKKTSAAPASKQVPLHKRLAKGEKLTGQTLKRGGRVEGGKVCAAEGGAFPNRRG